MPARKKKARKRRPVQARSHGGVLAVRYRVWEDPPVTVVHEGRRVEFQLLAQARDFAEKNGYEGIHVVVGGGKK